MSPSTFSPLSVIIPLTWPWESFRTPLARVAGVFYAPAAEARSPRKPSKYLRFTSNRKNYRAPGYSAKSL
ncbi:MAG: hypothetical protein Q6366_013850, partial [Candidatus Freyarchaeota archaeon]